MVIRPYRSADCSALAELFYETVHTACARDYTPEQLDAWAPGQVDLAAWDVSFLAHRTLAAVEDFQRRGVASALCDALEAASAAETFTTHASRTARPFLEHRGWRVVREQTVLRRGVALNNFVMEKFRTR